MYPLAELVDGLVAALDKVCLQAEEAILNGYSFLLLSDRKAGPGFVPVRYGFVFCTSTFTVNKIHIASNDVHKHHANEYT